jgi:hypothetical protein
MGLGVPSALAAATSSASRGRPSRARTADHIHSWARMVSRATLEPRARATLRFSISFAGGGLVNAAKASCAKAHSPGPPWM